jgi:hypothetical protein
MHAYEQTMDEVTKENFFRALSGNPRDVMPQIVNARYEHGGRGYLSEWRDVRSSQLFGVTESGSAGCSRPRYFLAKLASKVSL